MLSSAFSNILSSSQQAAAGSDLLSSTVSITRQFRLHNSHSHSLTGDNVLSFSRCVILDHCSVTTTTTASHSLLMFIQTNSVIKSNSSSLSARMHRTGLNRVVSMASVMVVLMAAKEKKKKDELLVTESLQSH